MLSVPYWLTNCSIDDVIDERYDRFNEARQVFLGVMDEEAKKTRHEHDIQVTGTMRDSWLSKGVWFWACIILPRFSASKELVIDLKQVSTLWREEVEQIAKTKVDDEEGYQEELQWLLEDGLDTS